MSPGPPIVTDYNAELSTSDVRVLLQLLFDTYPLYIDRESRRAVQQCLQAVVASPSADECLPDFIKALSLEAEKTGIAPANAFVLVEWFSLLLQQFADYPQLWNKFGLQVVVGDAYVLDTCLGSDTRGSVKHSGVVVTRRALRKIFRSGTGKDALNAMVMTLAAKGASPTARNAVFLGIIAGVCARLPQVKTLLDGKKDGYYAFYVREIIGSRTVLPEHIANALHDFFTSFTTMEDVQNNVVPAVEKALLRSPEVVLNNLVAPMVHALPSELDLSEILHKNLLKPLLSNIKSTNPVIRTGALSTFQSIAARSADEVFVEKIVDEILNPLKQNKVTAPEQKILHAQMLSALASSPPVFKKTCTGLAPLAVKEANEAVIGAQTQAVARHLQNGFAEGGSLDTSITEAFVKGIGDKRPSVRRIWALRAGEIIWSLGEEQLRQPDAVSFTRSVIGKMIDVWSEVIANPVPSAQSGLVTVAYIVTALGLSKLAADGDDTIRSVVKKASIAKHALVADPKPSFLLNHRVYTKLSTEDDIIWGVRALAAVTPEIAKAVDQQAISTAWSQAFLYFITASDMPPAVRKEATQTLAAAYVKQPARIGKIVVEGLWHWHHNIESNDKDTAASAAKTGNSELHSAMRCICLTPEEASKLGAHIEESTLRTQFKDLLVLCRPELIPRVSWIDMCLRTGIDPGDLARNDSAGCLNRIKDATEVSFSDKVGAET